MQADIRFVQRPEVDVTTAWESQDQLFSMEDYLGSNGHAQYDVSLDAQEFVMLRMSAPALGVQVIWVQNFFEELRRLVPN